MGIASTVRHAAAGAALLVGLTAAAFGQVPHPADMTIGSGLLEACSHEPGGNEIDFAENLRCTAYIDGLTTGMTAAAGALKVPEPFCLPAHTSVGEVQNVVLRELRTRPEVRKFKSSLVVWFTLRREFPCRRAKR